jgi:Tol biopolymer transport system component
VQNQDETGLDCGGSICAPCATCSDGVQNQDETGLDCGGSICGPCPTCSDGVKNQDETGVDCGGSRCAPCLCTFGAPQVLGTPPNGAGNSLWSPTLSSNGLTMYLSLTVSGGNEQIAVTTRATRGSNFSTPPALPSPVNSFIEGTPELSADGLSLYFFSEGFSGPASRDLYLATRASTALQFNTVRELTTINSSARDDRPWVSPDELTIYFCSQRASSSDDLWRATRTARSNDFGTPLPVTELNSSGNDAGIFLTPDGLVALFASDRTGGLGGVDIYRATRASTSSAFSTPQRLTAVNSSADDFDPQLTADGQELFFASTRSTGTYRLWRSAVTCP